ncbi:MAG: hypothetical protein AAGD09_03210 [Cyanobacteria bacterium P01_F01_bin.56]
MYSNIANSGFLTRLWRLISGTKDNKRMIGNQRSAVVSAYRHVHYDQEHSEYPIRDHKRALLLMDSIYGTEREKIFNDVLSIAESATFSSADGDDRGFTIGDFLQDGKTPVDPNVKTIALEVIRRRNGDHFVIGGSRLQPAVREFLGYGDSFWQLGIERDGNGYAVIDSLKMPCWEMFRKESDTGQLIQFEQRRRLMEAQPSFVFPAIKILHFRYRKRGLYGQSIFDGSLIKRARYQSSESNLDKVTNDTGSTPYDFEYPDGFTSEQQEQFKEKWDQKTKDGTVTAIWRPPGMKVNRLGSDVPNFGPLINYSRHLEYGLLPAGFPMWLIPGMETKGARDISGAPERAYVRMVNDFRAVLTDGIRKAIDIELFLKLGPDEYQAKVMDMGYSIVWPKITIPDRAGNPAVDEESDAVGIDDLDASTNGNGQRSAPTEYLHREFSTFNLR